MADLVLALNVPIHDAQDVLDLMGRTSREAVRLLPEVQWAGVTAQLVDGAPFTAAHTDEKVLIVDERQYAEGDGPCLQSMRTDREVRMTLADVEARWPVLAAGARAVGVNTFLAEPLHVRDESVGSLNLYSATLDALTAPDSDVLTVLTGYLDRGLTRYADRQPAGTLGASLLGALDARAAVERAVGVLMATHHVDPGQARDLLRRQASDAGTSTTARAELIISQQRLPPA